jgi:hypothetical protein
MLARRTAAGASARGPGGPERGPAARRRPGRLPDDEVGRDQVLPRSRLPPGELVDQHLGRHPARFERRPVDARERGGEHLGVLGRDHRDDGEVARHVQVGGPQSAEQPGELPAGRDRRRAVGLGAQQPGGDGERVARGVRARHVDAADAELGRPALEDVARDERRGVPVREQLRREVEEGHAGVPQAGEVREARLDGAAEVHVDEADAAEVVGPADQRERKACRPEPLDARILVQRLHQDDAVRAAPLDEPRDRVRIGRGGREQQRVVACARRQRRARDERLLDRDELPLGRRQEERDRVRGAAGEGPGRPVRPVVELLDRRQDALAHLARDRPLAAEDVRDRAQGDARASRDLRHRRRFRVRHRPRILAHRHARRSLDSSGVGW